MKMAGDTDNEADNNETIDILNNDRLFIECFVGAPTRLLVHLQHLGNRD